MLNRQSFAPVLAAIVRMLSVIRRAAALLFRAGAQTTPRHVDPVRRRSERARSASPNAAPTLLRLPLEEAHTLRGEYRAIRLSEIAPAAKPSRLVFEDIDRLADSIAGCAERDGLGLLAPVVVRILDDSAYELIDGHRRVRACQRIAARAGATDCRIPAIAFRVNAYDALLMRLASLDSAEPKPFELARTYEALRSAVAEEGGRGFSARGLSAVGCHGKTQVADYIRIADAISDDVLIAAELVGADGNPSPEALVDLTKRQLLDAAKRDTVESRAASIRAHLDPLHGRGRATPASSEEGGGAKDDTPDGAARTKGRTLSLMARSRTMSPGEARELIEREIAPAMFALVEQAHGRRDAEGYYSAITTGHACLVLPREVEGLTLEQLDRLDQALAMLTARTRRAREERLQVDAMFASGDERAAS